METRGEDVIAGEELYCPATPTVVTVVLLSLRQAAARDALRRSF
jgi:hypothetical protein